MGGQQCGAGEGCSGQTWQCPSRAMREAHDEGPSVPTLSLLRPAANLGTNAELTGSGCKAGRVDWIFLAESMNSDWLRLEISGKRKKAGWGGGIWSWCEWEKTFLK